MGAEKSGLPGDRNAILFVGMSLLDGFGGSVMTLVPAVWVLDLTASSSLAALVSLCVFVPTLAAPALGAVVDRLPRRSLLIATNTVTAVAVLVLFAVRSAEQLWLIYAVMLAYGVSLVLRDAGEAAILPAVLPPERLGAVNGLRVSAQEGMKLVAPLAGAGLFAWYGGHVVAALTALVLTGAAGLYALIRIGPVVARPRQAELTGQIRDGIRFMWTHRGVRDATLVGSITIAMSGLSTAGTYAVVTGDLHRPAAFMGVLASAQGAGSIVGGIIVGRLMKSRGEAAVGVLGAVLFAAGSVGRALPWWPAPVLGSFLAGVGMPWTLVSATTLIQRRTPEHMLGRVSATATAVLFAPIAIATPVGAAVVLVDRRLPLLIAAAACLVAALLMPRRLADGKCPGAEDSAPGHQPTLATGSSRTAG